MKIGSTRAGANQCPLGVERFGLTLCQLSYPRFVIFGIFFSVYIEACLLCFVCLYMVKSNEPLPVECGCKLALKFTALKFTIKPSLYRKPLASRERIFACETVEGLARSFMSFKKYKF